MGARYWVAFWQHDEAAMREQFAWAAGKPGAERAFYPGQADVQSYYGRFAEARESWRHAEKSTAATREDESIDLAREALREVEVGNTVRAHRRAEDALRLLPEDRDVKTAAGLALALAGDRAQPEKLANDLSREHPLRTLTQCCQVPEIRAAIKLNENDPGGAVKELEKGRRYEDGWEELSLPYLRGLAYLDARQGNEAEIEFRRVLFHRVVRSNFVVVALAQLQLGRAQVMMGDKDAARDSYNEFLKLWKNADPDIPIYQQAKIEYARLRH